MGASQVVLAYVLHGDIGLAADRPVARHSRGGGVRSRRRRRRVWGVCRKFSFRCVSDDDFWRAAKTDERSRRCSFWQAAKTGSRRIPVSLLLAGSQHRCSIDRAEALKVWLIALRRDFWLERLTEEKKCRKWYETPPPGWEYSLSWTLFSHFFCTLSCVLSSILLNEYDDSSDVLSGTRRTAGGWGGSIEPVEPPRYGPVLR